MSIRNSTKEYNNKDGKYIDFFMFRFGTFKNIFTCLSKYALKNSLLFALKFYCEIRSSDSVLLQKKIHLVTFLVLLT